MKELQENELESIQDDVYLLNLYTPFCGTCQLASKMLTVVEEMLPGAAFYKNNVNYSPHSPKPIRLKAFRAFCCLKAESLLRKDTPSAPFPIYMS
ncbi:Thioredoxin-like protein YusE [Bacillus velezensis]|nr:Thioredoxin-like protein YusE [Bacillus velezensis]